MAKQTSLALLPALPMLDNATRADYETYKSGKDTLHNRLVSHMEHALDHSGDTSQSSALIVAMINDGHDDDAEAVKAWYKAFSSRRWDNEKGRLVTNEKEKKARKASGKPQFDVSAARDVPFWEFKAPRKEKTAYDCDKALTRHIDAEKRATISEAKALRKAFDEGLTLDGDVAALVERLIATANRLNITIDIPETSQSENV